MISRFSARVRAGFPSDFHYGIAVVTFATIAWSSTRLFTRLIDLDPWTTLTWRGLFGGLTALAAVVIMHGRNTFAEFGKLGLNGLIFALLNAVGMLTYVGGLKATTVAHVTTIAATMPLMAALMSWLWLKERPGFVTISACLAAAAGVALTVVAGLGEGRLIGDFLALIMVAVTVVALVLQRVDGQIDPVVAAAVSGGACMLAAFPFGAPFAVSLDDLGKLAAFGFTNTGFGLILFFVGARYIPATLSGLISALDAPLSPIWVFLVFGETPRPTTILGGVIVVASVVGYLVWSMRMAGSDRRM